MNSDYVMAYFVESPNGSGNSDTVHLAVSPDALEWTPLNQNQPILTPTLGTKGIRDPFVYRLQDGTWVLLATDLADANFEAPNPAIHVWTSPDLVNWSADRLLTVNAPNTQSYSWAPEVFWDAGKQQYGILFSGIPNGSTTSKILVSYTNDFKTASSPSVFFDNKGQGGIIDADMVTGVNGTNYLYYRGTDATLRGAKSTSLDPGSFTEYVTAPPQGNCVEAPTVVRSLTNTNQWWLWGDNYCPNNKFDVWQGDVTTGSWTALSKANYTAPLGSKHNTIQPITSTEYNALLSKYGTTTAMRLKSWDFPDRYVRHQNGQGRIDPLPFDPQADSQWKVVPGLADPNDVSFESVNYPGSYLRHSSFNVVLNANDGSSQFAADATFKKVPGLANSSWSSFQSYNYPDRYIRHYSFQLQISPISTSTDQADATFHVAP
ncbi:glycoside hydrolase family 43 protein (plasmid) [Curtobacterium sp. C1]|uniref:glycoside hydrolase family 43 protein n=1 Tax=Curtobacterium sp. C1 TaxID=2898151 RepID=UPI001E3EDEBA|nr:glycoside hydrolase family 43 protein [Curtobacterium sp. C1]UFU15926.1 glycoside hydrolase family 43 protein [Curtobacterium sp. C1]